MDTVALVLLLEKRRIPSAAKKLVEKALAGEMDALIPAMALLEIGYLAEKGRISCALKEALALIAEQSNFSVVDISSEIILSAFEIDDIPELHDRVIAGTAHHYNAVLLTSDAVIQASKSVDVVWE